MTGATSWSPLRLAREAFALTFRGSRQDLAEVTAARTRAVLVFLVLTARCVILAQAGIDLAAASGAYARLGLAVGLAAACGAETALFALVVLRAQRLTVGALLGDAVFGAAGLVVMSAATTVAPGRAGSLNWMLPYTVITAVGLGLLPAVGLRPADGAAGAGRSGRGPAMFLASGAPVVAVLAAAYLLSACLPRRMDPWVLLWSNDANYGLFFGAAFVLAVLLQRWLTLIGTRDAEAMRQAAELSHEAHWRALTVDVFGPVLELLDDLEAAGGDVPAPVRAEAARLISLIEAVKPRTAGSPAPRVGAAPNGEAGGG